jgi:hypothetical protein
MKKISVLLIMLSFLTSCEVITDWTLQKPEQEFIIITGIITNELKHQEITITRPIRDLNQQADGVTDATVLVSSNQLAYTFSEDSARPGVYVSDSAFAGIENSTYSLLVQSGAEVYSAKALLESAYTDFEMIQPQQVSEGLFRIGAIPAAYNPTLPAMYEILLDWSAAPGYSDAKPETCKACVYYYSLPTIDVSEVFAPGAEKVHFPAGTKITERRYSLTQEHAAYYRALLLETTWQGGYFITATANVPTNLSAGALGYFGACAVVQKQAIVPVK